MSEGWRVVLLPLVSCVLTVCLIPPIRWLAARWGCVALPSKERWHQRPTPYLGGVAIFGGFLFPALVFSPAPSSSFTLVWVTFLMFALGVYDDLYRLDPATKFVVQIFATLTAIFFGYQIQFFSWPPFNILLTFVWIVGLTNAINLLDNMDGLAGGIGLIAALYLARLFYLYADLSGMMLALALVGSLAGFLLFNFHPASIFMGDAGSLFIGSALSLLAIQTHGQASNILSLVAIPALILLVPILDTSLVTITRLLRGQPISQGGKDHSSHRLVILGLSEPKAVFLLYGMAALSGGAALLIEQLSYTWSLVLVPMVVLLLALFTAYLAQVEIVPKDLGQQKALEKRLPALLSAVTYRRRLLEVILDFFLVAFAYYLAFAVRFDFDLEAGTLSLYTTSLPLVLLATYSAFFFAGLYRGVWRHTGLEDLVQLGKGVLGGTLFAVLLLLYAYRFIGYSRVVFVLYPLFLFFSVAGSRLSFRLFDLFVARPQTKGVPVLIYGAGDGGEIIVRECRKNPRLGYRPVGFLDDDPHKQGGVVYGLGVLGGVDKLAEVIEREKVQGVLISSVSILTNGNAEKARTLCRERDVWIRRLRLEFVEE